MNRMTYHSLKNSLLGIALLLAGCATTDTIERPQLPMPENWAEAVDAQAAAAGAGWWRHFNSAQLEALVEEALQASPDLAATAEKVVQTEWQVRQSGASLFPSLNLSGSTGRSRSEPHGGTASESDSTRLTLGASYEVDVWGRVSAGVSAAEAALAMAQYDYEAARLSLVAAVANAYFQTLALRERLAIAQENLAIAERVLRIVDARYRNGAASALDLTRQQTAVLTQRTALLPLEVQERQTLTALAILLGRLPQGFVVDQEGFTHLAIPAVAPMLPSELLLRRPDLARAEAQLVAADANVAAARAALLPSISLSASAGVASDALLSLSAATTSYSLSAAIVQSLFDGGRLRAQVGTAESRRREPPRTGGELPQRDPHRAQGSGRCPRQRRAQHPAGSSTATDRRTRGTHPASRRTALP